MALQALDLAFVTHGKELHRAQNRRTHHRRKRCTGRRSIGPSTGASILRALNQVVEQWENQPGHDAVSLPPQIYQNRYTLALMSEYRNILTAVVGVMMVQHDFTQPEARKVYEILIQDNSSTKGDPKFYLKKTDLKKFLKERFTCFKLDPSGDEIQMVTISETEAKANHAFQDRCARLLGGPFFTEHFNPDKGIPELASSTPDKDILENRRIRALVSSLSFKMLIESLGDNNMNREAKGPVLKISGPGDGNNGRHDLPEATEVDIQADIDAVVNGFFDSAKFRCQLKYPDFEVVVDGQRMDRPFAATAAADQRFKLPGVTKYVQIFATQDDRREIVSNLILRDTEVSSGKPWQSELTLEGKQTVTLSVEPEMDNTGNLANSYLVLTYDPRLSLLEKLIDGLKAQRARSATLLPSLAGKLGYATAIGSLFLVPFFTIKVFSFAALLVSALALTVFLIVGGKLKPAWKWIRPQQVAIDSFMALTLVALLFFGILPIGQLPQSATTSMTANSLIAVIPRRLSDDESPTLAAYVTAFESRDEFIDYNTGTFISEWRDPNNFSPTSHHRTESSLANHLTQAVGSSGSTVASQVSLTGSKLTRTTAGIVQTKLPPGASTALARKTLNETVSARSGAVQGGVFNVEVLVDTTQVLTLIRDGSSAGPILSSSALKSQARITEVALSTSRQVGSSALNRRAGETQPGIAESQISDPSPGLITTVSARQTPALVVFDSPMQLAKLNKGDVLKANFKPIALTIDPRAAVLECTATGVVQDIKRTDGTNVEIRVGLSLTWLRDGNVVNSNLDLLLTDCAQQKENSHYGVLAAPEAKGGEVARLESRYRKP
jgi:hypothetical protein